MRALRVRQNEVKLTLYRHFTAAILGTVASKPIDDLGMHSQARTDLLISLLSFHCFPHLEPICVQLREMC